MKIQVLGSGCPTCNKLYEVVQKAVAEMEIKEEVEYVTGAEGIGQIVELGVMSSPVLTVDGQVAMVGFNQDIEKIKEAIRDKAKKE